MKIVIIILGTVVLAGCGFLYLASTKVIILNRSSSAIQNIELEFRNGIIPPFSPVRIKELKNGDRIKRYIATEGKITLRYSSKDGDIFQATEGYVSGMDRVYFLVYDNGRIEVTNKEVRSS